MIIHLLKSPSGDEELLVGMITKFHFNNTDAIFNNKLEFQLNKSEIKRSDQVYYE